MLGVIMSSVVMLSVIMLSAVAPGISLGYKNLPLKTLLFISREH
jgi:hypothetical protein